MRFSFIITSRGDDGQLENCISSIERASSGPTRSNADAEILVVFQNIRENGCGVRTGRAETCTFYYTAGRGLSSARNYAIERSRGDYLIFLDDDAEIKEDFLSVLSKYCSELTTDAFCGRIIDKGTGSVYGHCFADKSRKYLRVADFRYFMGSSHILKRDVIARAGLYDERFGAGARYRGAEETDLFFRLKQKGLRVIYAPELVYYHPWIYSESKVFNYSYAVAAALTKQIFSGGRYVGIYLAAMAGTLCKAFLRAAQDSFFSKNGTFKNFRSHYRLVFFGALNGIFDYSKDNLTAKFKAGG